MDIIIYDMIYELFCIPLIQRVCNSYLYYITSFYIMTHEERLYGILNHLHIMQSMHYLGNVQNDNALVLSSLKI